MARDCGLRRSAPILPAIGLVLATALAFGAPSRPLTESRTIPPNAWMVFSVPDLPGAWTAFTTTPIYQDVVTLLDNPSIASLPFHRAFFDEKRRMEAELGFPINAQTLTAMVAGLDLVFLPPAEPNGPSLSVIQFRAADPERFGRLVKCIERQMEGAPSSDGSAIRRSDAARLTYKNVEIVSRIRDSHFALAQLGPALFAMGSHPNAVRALIDQGGKSEGLTATRRFRSAVGGLAEPASHGFLYLNTAPVARTAQTGRVPGLALSSLVRSLRDEVAVAADFRIERNAVRFESFAPFSEAAHDRLAAIYQHYPPGPLHSLTYVSSAPLVLVARNTLDGPALYESLRAMILAAHRAVGDPGQNPEQRLQTQEENFRETLGFGVREDLAPAVGPEAFVSLERISFDPLIPLPAFELVTGVQVRDRQRMDRVVAGFEGFFERQLRPNPTETTSPAVLQSALYQGRTIKWFAIPRAPQYALGYTPTEDFVLMGLGGDSIRRALDRADGRRKSFATGQLYAALRPFLHPEANEIVVVNVPGIVAVGREFARRLSKTTPNPAENAKRAELLLSRIGRITALGASTNGSDLGLHTRGALVLRPSEARSQSPKSPAAGKPK